MNKELLNCGYYVCSIIGNTLNNNTDIKEYKHPDNELVSNFIQKHHIGSIIGCCVQNSDKFNSFFSQYTDSINDALFRKMKFDIMRDKISADLSDKKIRHIILKGSEIERFYPDFVVRTTSDIDFYINKKDIKNACIVMKNADFTMGNIYDKTEYQFFKQPRYNIELHTALEGFSKKQKNLLLSLVENSIKIQDYRYRLSDSDCYIHALFHLYKHFVSSGVGVRMFLDLFLITKNADIDFEYTDKILDELGILEFSRVVSQINDVLFCNNTADEKLSEVIYFIFFSGIYGTASANLHLNQINQDIKHMSKIKHLSNSYGLSFEKMKKRYPVLKKAPYLYPFSFIHRFFYGIINKQDVIKNDIMIKKSISKDNLEKYKKIFRNAKIIK